MRGEERNVISTFVARRSLRVLVARCSLLLGRCSWLVAGFIARGFSRSLDTRRGRRIISPDITSIEDQCPEFVIDSMMLQN